MLVQTSAGLLSIRFQYEQPKRPKSYRGPQYPHTICQIASVQGPKDPNPVELASVRIRYKNAPGEQPFTKGVGRRRALRDALLKVNITRDGRLQVYEAYNERHADQFDLRPRAPRRVRAAVREK